MGDTGTALSTGVSRVCGNALKRGLYDFIIDQLYDDGFIEIGTQLASAIGVPVNVAGGIDVCTGSMHTSTGGISNGTKSTISNTGKDALYNLYSSLLYADELHTAANRHIRTKRKPNSRTGGHSAATEPLKSNTGLRLTSDDEDDARAEPCCGVNELATRIVLASRGLEAVDTWQHMRTGKQYTAGIYSGFFSRDGAPGSSAVVQCVDRWTAQHKANCSVVACSEFGTFIACGGDTDGSLRVMERTGRGFDRDRYSDRAAGTDSLRNFEGHTGPVSSLAFLHEVPLLFTGSATDINVKIYQLNKQQLSSKAFAQLRLAAAAGSTGVSCMEVHPSGDYLYVGGSSSCDGVLRLYDLNTLSCYCSPYTRHAHTASLSRIACVRTGFLCATSSKDGSIKLWDAVSNRVVNEMRFAHCGANIQSLQWSDDLTQLMSSGCDGATRFWDLRTGKQSAITQTLYSTTL
eukprot:Lankesteria_metandrocarpae@DN3007_c0_g1_i2.p1